MPAFSPPGFAHFGAATLLLCLNHKRRAAKAEIATVANRAEKVEVRLAAALERAAKKWMPVFR
jgi:hypothetical protein